MDRATGYFGMPERTVEAYRNLWFHTGDAGRFDERGKLVLRRPGRRPDPAPRRERGLGRRRARARHHAWRHRGGGRRRPADEEGGEDEIKACLVAGRGASIDAEQLWAWCDERLPYFAVPRYLELYDALPKTPTEKVLKHQLRVTREDAVVVDRGPSGRRGVAGAGPVSGAR